LIEEAITPAGAPHHHRRGFLQQGVQEVKMERGGKVGRWRIKEEGTEVCEVEGREEWSE